MLVSILQVYAFLGIAFLFGIKLPPMGYVWVLPALMVSGLMLGAVGLFLASTIRQLENFAGVMNFVIFPVFFLSTALYPLWRMAESSRLLRDICAWNPFSHAVELIRFALYMRLNPEALGWIALTFAVFMTLGLWEFDHARGIMTRKARPGTRPDSCDELVSCAIILQQVLFADALVTEDVAKIRHHSRIFVSNLIPTGCDILNIGSMENWRGALKMKRLGLDATDIRILAAVQKHGQLSKTRLAEIANISPTPGWARLDRLKAAGLIRGYHSDIALERICNFTQVVVTVSLTHHRKADFERFESFINSRDEITECIATGGGMDYVLKVFSPDLAAFQSFIQAMLDAEPGVDRYMTYIVTRTVKATHPNLVKLASATAR